MSTTQPILVQEKTAETAAGLREELQALLEAAEAAEKRYDHETAVAHYTAALELPGQTPKERQEILSGRAVAYRNWGISEKYINDVMGLILVVREMGDKKGLAKVMANHGGSLIGQSTDTAFFQEAVTLAKEFQNDHLLSLSFLTLGRYLFETGETDAGWQKIEKAMEIAQGSKDKEALCRIVLTFSFFYSLNNQPEDAQRFAREARHLADELENLYFQTTALNVSGMAEADYTRKRAYWEKALSYALTTNNQNQIASLTSNLSLILWQLGLYGRALAFAKESLENVAFQNEKYGATFALDSLGRAYLGKGALEDARTAFQQGIEYSGDAGRIKSFHTVGLAEVALLEGNAQEAIDLFQEAITCHEIQEPKARAGMGIAYLITGDLESALVQTRQATNFLQSGKMILEFPSQEIWWRHYQVLQAADPAQAFEVLDRARETMLEPITTISDEGLRRNYLNKVAINRDITLTWTDEAARRGLSTELFTAHEPVPGNLREQFRRVVDIGARLAAEHNPETLADFIIEEFVEMSGAERALLLLLDSDGSLNKVASFNPGDALKLARSLLEEVQQGRQPLLRQGVGFVPDGEVPELHQRSLIALPLIAQGRLLGILYGDMRQVFGRFGEADKNLLGMLAHQAAAALENAELVSTLEAKVAERTADLERRAKEMASLAEVGRDISATLELTAVLERIAGHALDLLEVSDSVILLPDETREAMRALIALGGVAEQMKALEVRPGVGILGDVWQRRQAELLNDPHNDPRGITIEGTEEEADERMMVTPLLSGDDIVGLMAVWRPGPQFTDSDLTFLDGLARQAAIAIQNAQLYHDAEVARAAAIKANESKSAFLANMSHELRTPLNAIIGFSRIVQRKSKECLPQRQQENLGKILSSGEHLLGLINTILDIAKIEAGRMDINESRFQVGPLIENLAMTAQPLLRRDVILQTDITPDLPPLVSDQDKVKQILLNLLSNAAKFTHEGSITISARLDTFRCVGAIREAPLQVMDCLAIAVRDTGIGISEEALGRIFEEFQQADELTRRHYGGTGLGLSISKQLAHLLGGDITAESRPGEGSTFTLFLPLEAQTAG